MIVGLSRVDVSILTQYIAINGRLVAEAALKKDICLGHGGLIARDGILKGKNVCLLPLRK